MAVKERLVKKIKDRIMWWRMGRIIKRYEKKHKEDLDHITLQEEWLMCFEEYCARYKRRRKVVPLGLVDGEVLIARVAERYGVTPEEIELEWRGENKYDVYIKPIKKAEKIEITVTYGEV